MKRMSDRAAEYFAHVDGIDRYGLVALDPEKQDEIIGVVSFYREGRNNRADYAALVEDRWQELGVGLGLTRRLIDEARGKGIRRLYGLVAPENRGMLKLFRRLDLPGRESRSRGAKYVEVELVA